MRDFCKFVTENGGPNNIRVFLPVNPIFASFMGISVSSADKEVVKECRIVERSNRSVKDNYKLIFKPLDENYAYSDMYVMDFESLARDFPDRYYFEVINDVGSKK